MKRHPMLQAHPVRTGQYEFNQRKSKATNKKHQFIPGPAHMIPDEQMDIEMSYIIGK